MAAVRFPMKFFYFMGVKPYEKKYRLKKSKALHDTTALILKQQNSV
jgi:hypothetical protein